MTFDPQPTPDHDGRPRGGSVVQPPQRRQSHRGFQGTPLCIPRRLTWAWPVGWQPEAPAEPEPTTELVHATDSYERVHAKSGKEICGFVRFNVSCFELFTVDDDPAIDNTGTDGMVEVLR